MNVPNSSVQSWKHSWKITCEKNTLSLINAEGIEVVSFLTFTFIYKNPEKQDWLVMQILGRLYTDLVSNFTIYLSVFFRKKIMHLFGW